MNISGFAGRLAAAQQHNILTTTTTKIWASCLPIQHHRNEPWGSFAKSQEQERSKTKMQPQFFSPLSLTQMNQSAGANKSLPSVSKMHEKSQICRVESPRKKR